MREEIIKGLQKVTGEKEIHLEVPEREEFGDYSSNVALKLKSQNSKVKTTTQISEPKNPRQIAEEIKNKLIKLNELNGLVEKIEIAGQGFINFWLSRKALGDVLIDINIEKDIFGKTYGLKSKKFLIEHTSPNTIKTLHVGHVRNNVLGMAIHNILEFAGADVSIDAINNDRGIHVMKAVWTYMKYGEGKTPEEVNQKPDHFVDQFYVRGAKEAENPEVKEEMREHLRRWEAGDEEVRSVWKKLRDWTFEGFRETYKRLGSSHDQQWFESDFYQHGKEIVDEGLKKGVFRKLEDGAVLSDLKKYSLTDTIILRSDGTSMYHTQDLYLTKLKREKFNADLYIWDIGPEQELYLKQLFAMCEQLGIGKLKDYMHMAYGFVFLKGGRKMSSRAGNVISADDLIDDVVAKARKIIEKSETQRGLGEEEKEEISEAVGLGAIKYGLLKVGRSTDIYFDIDESLSLEGNSGPYLQYTFARTQSVLRKLKTRNSKLKTATKNLKSEKFLDLNYSFDISALTFEFNEEELKILRSFVHFPEVIADAAKNYSPNLLCNYLYDLAQKFNLFYSKHRILNGGTEKQKNLKIEQFRLSLTVATSQILKNGLNLLGIETPEKM